MPGLLVLMLMLINFLESQSPLVVVVLGALVFIGLWGRREADANVARSDPSAKPPSFLGSLTHPDNRRQTVGWALGGFGLFVVISLLSGSGNEFVSPLIVLGVVGLLVVALVRTVMAARGSLRRQIGAMGLIAVLLPMTVLVVLVATGSQEFDSSSEIPEPPEPPEEPEEPPEPPEEPGSADEETNGLPIGFALAALALTGGASFAVSTWSSRAVKPMAAITEVANEIQAGSLDRRIGLTGATGEVQALADSFDAMLDRLATASEDQRRLIEDTSHELRTPLAALAINNEVMLNNQSPTLEDYRASTERNEALVKRLQSTLDELLLDARTRAAETRQVDNDIMAIIRRVTTQHRIVSPEVAVVVRGPAALLLGIDGPSVERAIANLVENAARYTPPGAPVAIDVVEGERVRVSVSDYGPGIPADEIDAIFERYHQSDESGESGTMGIGLALVEQVAAAHGGVEVVSPLPGDERGTRFTMTFDLPPEAVRQ